MIPVPAINHPAVVYGGEAHELKGETVLLWGPPGCWKTTWCAQWPGVVFLSIAAEGGDDALKMYPEIARMLMANSRMNDTCPPVFNTERPPCFQVRSKQQFEEYVDLICKNRKAWKICTVVVDGLCYLIDLWVQYFVEFKEKQGKSKAVTMGGDLVDQQGWGFLNMFLRETRMKFQNEGLNVIWTTLQHDTYKSVMQPSGISEMQLVSSVPMVKGQNRVTLSGACKMHIHADRIKVTDMQNPERMRIQPIFWTSSNAILDARHKYFNKFPYGKLIDPEFGDLPTFRAFWIELHEFIYTG